MLDFLLSRQPLFGVTVTTIGLMILGTAIRFATLGSSKSQSARSRLASLRTWWILLGLLLTACWLGPVGVVLLLAAFSTLALDEFLKVSLPQLAAWPRRLWLGLMIVSGYGTLLLTGDRTFQVLLPMLAIWSLVLPHLWEDSTRGYLDHVGRSLWGVMVLVWGVSHAGWLVLRPDLPVNAGTPIGWFLLLVLLTEINDIAQALVGRQWGRHRILPNISPNKTWEGLAGGMIVTMLAGLLASSFLTPGLWQLSSASPGLRVVSPLLAGLVISVSGLIGDLNISCVKRDVGVKDGSQLLPGQGGVIDRIDSLSFTAPAFSFYVTGWLATLP